MTEKKSRLIEILGFVPGILTTLAFVPQVILLWKMAPAPAIAISLPTYAILCLGIFGWMVYGILIKDRPIIFWNFITFFFVFSVLVYKFIYG